MSACGRIEASWVDEVSGCFVVFVLANCHEVRVQFHGYVILRPKGLVRNIPVPIKIKFALPPTPQTQKYPPLKRGTWRFSCRKNAEIPGAHKIGAAICGPRIADKNFMDARIFLSWGLLCLPWYCHRSSEGG